MSTASTSTKPQSAIVIGAGVVGTATAYSLARRGMQVTIIDARDKAAHGTSYANGGQLSYLYTGSLANHRIRSELPELALGMNPAFRIRINPDPDFIAWLLSFLRNCTRARYQRNSRASLEIALESQAAMLSFLQKHALDFDYQVKGKIQLLYTQKAINAIEENFSLKGLTDADQSLMDLTALEKLEPAIKRAGEKPMAGLFTPSEAVGDARKFAMGMLDLLTTEYDVTTHMGHRVSDVDLNASRPTVTLETGLKLETDLVVLCTGPDKALMRKLGLKLPIFSMKGYSITAPRGAAAPDISITDSKRRLVFTPLGDKIRIGGMADLGWTNWDVDPRRLEVLMSNAQHSFPEAADYSQAHDQWAGLRPMTPDSVPRLGRPHPSLIYNLGHGMLGWTMAMGCGERVARLIDPNPESF